MPTVKPTNADKDLGPETVEVFGPESAASQNARNIRLIIGREYKARVQSRGFMIGTVLLMLLVIAMVFIPIVIQAFFATTQTKMAVVNTAGAVAGGDATQYLGTILNGSAANGSPAAGAAKPLFEIKTAQPAELESVRQQVRDGNLNGVLIIERAGAGDLNFEYYTNENPTSSSPTLVRAATEQLNVRDKLSRLGIAASQQSAVLEQPQFKLVSSVEERSGRTQNETNAALLVLFLGIILLSMSINIYGASIATGVAEEKSTRIMEIMITAATPFQLMMGKIIGTGLVGLTQMAGMALVGGLALLAQAPIKTALLGTASAAAIDLTGLSFSLLGLLVLYFILGFLLYAALYAIAGALVSRQEEVGSVSGSVGLLLMVGYLSSVPATVNPDATWVVVGSYIPFFTPMLMLARMGLGAAPLNGWEVLISSAIMVATILICTWIAARIYRVGVLMYGQKPSLEMAFRLFRSG